ncbi:Rne/Rng family ribonuclease [Amylibacter sp. SFDW26]|uniref:Rne/Rng family ribonuclease n=1 Tax=Amylibacter sp. SFDW26 TaxID=2652722 RepID=UPI0012619E0C|nr:ribonuclease E/G [Amylibacter sp. SFDW26]KAB7615722.1 Rne/Rng family ribonuclease [Amylibacter sp. SFDW26]
MSKKMLIDATHPEETRVVVVEGNKVDEFDFESLNKRQLAGNIYLAKVTRVEPSLQAAFVDYGGNRHGFLAFNEIHPDYYQIPVADRERLLAEEAAYAKAMAEEEARRAEQPAKSRTRRRRKPAKAVAEAAVVEDAIVVSDVVEGDVIDVDATESDLVEVPEAKAAEKTKKAPKEENTPTEEIEENTESETSEEPSDNDTDEEDDDSQVKDDTPKEGIESVADDDVSEEVRPRKPRLKRYKIQEVIKVRQILLIQVVKEERGNKGAALTTYLSLAGRYCVLMPNTARGGGISRKITNAADRKKIKAIANKLVVPEGAGLIIRTAGASRNEADINRDYEFLSRQWEQIRELTLKSIAPAPIYEEGNLIKRSIRDLYTRDIDEIHVEGQRGYDAAREYMTMFMPNRVDKVKLYREQMPLFSRYQVETHLGAMFNPTVQLKSGGYLVIGITEALVAVDVNSGKATKENSIEATALKTNLEAAEEVARQMRLRDLAGLIVIDFIDMEERRNNTAVEKRLKDKLKNDRARIQVGRISGFGLLEMSRQRLRPGMLEATTQECPHCHGTGLLRSDDSLALSILRELEEEGVRKRSREVLVKTPINVANYLLNEKRDHISKIETRYGLSVRVEADVTLIGTEYSVEKFKTATRFIPQPENAPVSMENVSMEGMDDVSSEASSENDEEEKPKKKSRRRRGGRGRGRNKQDGENPQNSESKEQTSDAETETTSVTDVEPTTDTSAEKPKRKRAPRKTAAEKAAETETTADASADAEEKPKRKRAPRKTAAKKAAETETTADAPADAEEKPKRKRAPRKTAAEKAAETETIADAPADAEEKPKRKRAPRKTAAKKATETETTADAPADAEEKPKRKRAPRKTAAEKVPEQLQVVAAGVETTEPAPIMETTTDEKKPKRRGWWSRG